MKKPLQNFVNETVKEVWGETMNRRLSENLTGERERLLSCSATFATYDNFVVLRSYNTEVAIFDLRTNTLYDALRMVYGYTSTSAQHIAKFRNVMRERYLLGWDEIRELRYYPVA